MYHIAQVNAGLLLGTAEDEFMAGFFDNLDRINALAEQAPGFVWRLQSEQGNATNIILTDDPRRLINMSVWESVEALRAYAYETEHLAFVKRRKEWFMRFEGAYQALWWIPAGEIPTPQEGLRRLGIIDRKGPCTDAFNFKTQFPPPQ